MRVFHSVVAWSSLLIVTLALPSVALQPAQSRSETEASIQDWTLGLWRGARYDENDGSEASIEIWVEPALDGLGKIEQLVVEGDDAKYRGLAVESIDPESGDPVRYYINNVRSGIVELRGVVEIERSEWRRESAESTVKSRLISERIAPNGWRRTQSISKDGGITWTVLWRDELQFVSDRR
ncbi:MAG: hypothetical protein P8Y44_11330 [Acidobacteriota bacterium]